MLLCGEWSPAQGAVDFSPSCKVPLGLSLPKSLWKWMAHGELTHGCYLPPSHTPPQRPHPPMTVIPSISEKATLMSCERAEQVPFMDGVFIKIQLQVIIESDFSFNCQVQDFVCCCEAAFFFFHLIAHIREVKSKMLHRLQRTASNPEVAKVSTPQASPPVSP